MNCNIFFRSTNFLFFCFISHHQPHRKTFDFNPDEVFRFSFYFCPLSLGFRNRGSPLKVYFGGLRQVSRNQLCFSLVLLQSRRSLHLYFSRHVSFKCPCGTKQCLSTCRWFQWNLSMLLFRAPHERQHETNWGTLCMCASLCLGSYVYWICLCVGRACLCDALWGKLAHTQQTSLGRAAGSPLSHVGPSQMCL